jgi:uncharacterized repeat protein (TIGR01451 family)
MHRLTGSSATRLRRCSWLFLPGLVVVLLSLFVSIFADIGSRAHAATQSALENTHETEFIHRRPDAYHANGLVPLIGQVANLSRIDRSNAKQPALMLTRTNSPDTLVHGKHGIEYVLSVSNGHAAGPVAAGNTITVSNVIPAGVTGLTARAKKSDWNVKLASKTGPTILTATYVGSYPVLAGASLSPIIVHGTLGHTDSHPLLIPAIVRLLHTNNPKKSSATTLQQQSAHVFTVKGGTTPTPKGGPSGGTNPGGITPKGEPSGGVTPSGIAPQVVSTYQPGQTVVYTLAITNSSTAGPVLPGDSITVTDPIPAGLTGITVSAITPTDWSITPGGSVSPTTLTATYTGSYPVAAGATLSPITITGTLTSTAIPQVTNTAVVVTPNDSNTGNNSGTATFNVAALPDLTITNPVPTGTYEVGKPVTYTLTGSDVSTAGPVLAGDPITIIDTIPAGLTGITATGSSTNWNIGVSATSGPATVTATYIGAYPVTPGMTLPPITVTGTLASAAVPTLSNTVTISTPRDSNTANNTAANTLPVAPQPDLTLTKTTPGGVTYQVGLPATYTITASNGSSAGPVLAGDSIIITDSIPAGFSGLTAVASTPADWTVSLAGTTSPTTLTATYKGSYPVASGATLSSITLSGILTSTSTPQLINTATVTTPNDGNPANNSGSSTIPVLAIPDLTITNPVPAGTTFEVGKPVTYILTGSDVSTAGPVIASDSIIITETIPAGLTGITATGSSTNWTLSLSATSGPATLTATYIGSYPVNPGTALPPITITGTLTSAAMPTLSNTATIHTPKDINATNDTASNSIPVVPQPDLSLTKTIPAAGSLQVGHSVTYSLVASNGSSAGPVIAGDPIIITDTIPAGFSGLTVSANTAADWTVGLVGTASPTTMTATYKGSYPVASGATLSAISLTGTLTLAANPQVTNAASVSTPNDSNAANNNASITTPVLLAPDLSLSKTVALSATSSVRGQVQAKPKDKTFHAAIGVKSTNSVSSKVKLVSHRSILSLNSSEDLLPTFQGGQHVTYKLTISNSKRAGPVIKGDPIILVDKIPAGLTSLNASADSTYWVTSLNATTSPTTLTATYVGPYPVLAGARLPAVTLNGVLTGAASRLTNTAQVKTPDDTGTIGKSGHTGHTSHTGTTSIKVIPAPDMAITKTNFGGHSFYPGQMVQYELRVYSTHASGPINASVPIHVTDLLPEGAYQVKAYGTDWQIAIKQSGKNTMVVATYTGHYPLVIGNWLPRIIVDARFKGHFRSSRVNTAQVIVPYDSNPRNNTSRDTIVIHTPALPPTGSDPNA